MTTLFVFNLLVYSVLRLLPLTVKHRKWYYHLFKRYAAVLERVFEICRVIVEVVWISHEVPVFGEYICRTYIGAW